MGGAYASLDAHTPVRTAVIWLEKNIDIFFFFLFLKKKSLNRDDSLIFCIILVSLC